MIVELRTRKREGGWRREQYRGYEQIREIRGMNWPIGFRIHRIVVPTRRIGSGTCRIRNGQLPRTQNSLQSQFLIMISPISSHPSLSRPQLYHYIRTHRAVIPLYLSMPSTWVNTEYSIHRVLHHTMINILPLPASLSSLGRPSCTEVSTFQWSWVWPMNRASAPVRTVSRYTAFRSTTAKCISKPVWWWPPSVSPNSLNHSFQVRTINGLQTRSITAYKCILKFTQSQAVSASPNSLYHGLQVHLSVHAISASKCISKLPRSRLPSTHDEWPPNSFDYRLQVHLSVHSITASKFTWWLASKLVRSSLPSASVSSLNHGI